MGLRVGVHHAAGMPRLPRPDLAGLPQHVVQRGNNRLPCFFDTADYRCYLTNLRAAAQRTGCAVHAYVLMTNHVHLLVTPTTVSAVSRRMQMLRNGVRFEAELAFFQVQVEGLFGQSVELGEAPFDEAPRAFRCH